MEPEILPACRELGIGFVSYSPLGRGFLTGKIQQPDELGEADNRKNFPRFQGENLEQNKRWLEAIKAIAAEKGCTPGQLAIAWVLAQGEDIVTIPGTKRRKYLEENLGAEQRDALARGSASASTAPRPPESPPARATTKWGMKLRQPIGRKPNSKSEIRNPSQPPLSHPPYADLALRTEVGELMGSSLELEWKKSNLPGRRECGPALF